MTLRPLLVLLAACALQRAPEVTAPARTADSAAPSDTAFDPLDRDGDGWQVPADCDDTRLDVYPGGPEVDGDGVDGDCDGVERCWIDADDDESPSQVLGPPGDADCDDPFEQPWVGVFDCDDDNYNKWPGAPETPGDGVDHDCDEVDACHVDLDRDGFYDPNVPPIVGDDLLCDDPGEAPPGATPLDCDDTDPSVYGTAPETLLGVDKNCDGFVQCRVDADGDGFAPNPSPIVARYLVCDAGYTTGPTTDCDDRRADRRPDAPEIVGDRVDSDCDGLERCWMDADGDGAAGTSVVTSSSIRCAAPGVTANPARDCDDLDAEIGAGPPEAPGDDIDDDCDGIILCYVDADDDGHLPANPTTAPSADADCDDAGEGRATDPRDDCNSADPAIPAPDVPGDGVDRDCDGAPSCYIDSDGDGAAGTIVHDRGTRGCNAFEGEFVVAPDCDDANALVSPLAVERPGDGLDNDCDGVEACFVDDDGDTWGTDAERTGPVGCAAPGLAARAGDCDDDAPDRNPGVEDIPADNLDNDCDGLERCFADADGDGAPTAAADVPSDDLDCDDAGEGRGGDPDCDDTNPRIRPSATEIAADGLDQDCDGLDSCQRDADGDALPGPDTIPTLDADCDDPGEAAPWIFPDCDDADPEITFQCASLVCYADLDGDGFGVDPVLPRAEQCLSIYQQAAIDGDCNDAEPEAWPGNLEITANGLDDDCDGAERCFLDEDGDGVGVGTFAWDRDDHRCDDFGEAPVDGDCNDDESRSYPFNQETPGDGVDGNCDGFENCFSDEDRDGIGSPRLRLAADWTCASPGLSARSDDCVDDDPTRSPLAAEVPGNPFDEDCSGTLTCFADLDRDGHGTPELVERALACTDGASLLDDDCDDASADISPSAGENRVGDGVDQDCDGRESCYRDQDGDGVGGGAPVPSDDLDCADPGETATEPEIPDCDDTRADVYPGAREREADGIDQSCDGLELCYVDADQDTYPNAAGRTALSPDRTCREPGFVPTLALGADCDDTDPDRHPDAPEPADATVDLNCDGELPGDPAPTDPTDAPVTDAPATDPGDDGSDTDVAAPQPACGCAGGPPAGWPLILVVPALWRQRTRRNRASNTMFTLAEMHRFR